MSFHDGTRILLEMLTCPICLERLQSPRTLPCLHTFCTECLERCRRPHRHSLDCPVCKRSVPLTSLGVRALQFDHRIQQIEDIFNDHNNRPQHSEVAVPEAANLNVKCQLCKVQKKNPVPDAAKRCVQCDLVFCMECSLKHDANPVLSSHGLHDISDSVNVCPIHASWNFKYYCKQCQMLLCTVCILEHNEEHEQEPWDRSTVERYKGELSDIYQQVSIKVRELKSKTKHLETLRQTHQGSLHLVQNLIKSRANEMVQKIRIRECQLLDESQIRFDGFLRELGIDNIGDLSFKQSQIEALYVELEALLNDNSPCKCILSYGSIMAKYRSLMSDLHGKSTAQSAANLSAKHLASKKTIKFIPSCTDDMNFLIGSLQEFSVMNSNDDNLVEQRHSSAEFPGFSLDTGDGAASLSLPLSFDPLNYRPHRKRTKVILDAVCRGVSPRHELGKFFKRMKSPSRMSSRSHSSSTSQAQDGISAIEEGGSFSKVALSSAFLGLNRNKMLSVSSNDVEQSGSSFDNFACNHLPSTSSVQSNVDLQKCLEALNDQKKIDDVRSKSLAVSLREGSLVSRCIRQFMQIERIGSLLGNLLPTKSICFIKGSDTKTFEGGLFADLSRHMRPPSDWLLVVAETGHRLHVFDSRGSSTRLIGWGNIKPQVVAYSKEGFVYCTDRKDMTVKTFHLRESWLSTSWQVGMFDHPHGLAITTRGHLVVTDIIRNSVTVHCSTTGRILQRLSHPAETFSKPAYVAVDGEDNVYVSDVCKKCIFVFNMNGCFVRSITLPFESPESLHSLPSSSSSTPSPPLPGNFLSTSIEASPHGLAVDPNGHLAICDWRNNRIISCPPDGSSFSVYGQCLDLIHPTNISFDSSGRYFAVTESIDSVDNECGRIKVYEFARSDAA